MCLPGPDPGGLCSGGSFQHRAAAVSPVWGCVTLSNTLTGLSESLCVPADPQTELSDRPDAHRHAHRHGGGRSHHQPAVGPEVNISTSCLRETLFLSTVTGVFVPAEVLCSPECCWLWSVTLRQTVQDLRSADLCSLNILGCIDGICDNLLPRCPAALRVSGRHLLSSVSAAASRTPGRFCWTLNPVNTSHC